MRTRRPSYRSFTVRADVGGHPTELHKRIAAYEAGGLLPDWTAQGYIARATGRLHHAGIIATRELVAGLLAARASGEIKLWTNPEDGHKFWAGFWDTLRRYGNATTLRTIEPPGAPAEPAALRDMANPDCWYPDTHRASWAPHPLTGRTVCHVCHPPVGR